MFKKSIIYNDYNGIERSEDFYFNLTKSELIEMEIGTTGGLGEMMDRIVRAQDAPSIMKVFKDLILKSYGEKSLDGKRFIKINDEGIPVSRAFAQTEAYNSLFMELLTSPDSAIAFLMGIIPADAAKAIEEQGGLKKLVNMKSLSEALKSTEESN